MPNYVYIAMSLDGFIAGKDDELEWLIDYPNEEEIDYGYNGFIQNVDALLMGRRSYEAVLNFDSWLYDIPVFVLSSSITSPPDELKDKVTIVNGELDEVLTTIQDKGFSSLYIDGGQLIQSMLQENYIDELIVTIIPILLGGGIPLFGELTDHIDLKLLNSITFYNGLVQTHYRVV